MNIEEVRDYCLSKPFVEESFPFDEETLVFKVANKMFALLPLDNVENQSVNLKGEPEKNIEYRERFEGVEPGFHMNKKHWNTVMLDSDIDMDLIKQMIDVSYDLVLAGVPKRIKNAMGL